jgi:predicted DNA-binding protein
MEDLRESHAAALSRHMGMTAAYIRGEVTEAELEQSGRDLDMTSDLLERGLNPSLHHGKEAGS